MKCVKRLLGDKSDPYPGNLRGQIGNLGRDDHCLKALFFAPMHACYEQGLTDAASLHGWQNSVQAAIGFFCGQNFERKKADDLVFCLGQQNGIGDLRVAAGALGPVDVEGIARGAVEAGVGMVMTIIIAKGLAGNVANGGRVRPGGKADGDRALFWQGGTRQVAAKIYQGIGEKEAMMFHGLCGGQVLGGTARNQQLYALPGAEIQ
jgi:hypothetical protein